MLFTRSFQKSIALVVFVFFVLIAALSTFPRQQIFLPEKCQNKICMFSYFLAQKFNHSSFRLGKSYTLYMANFEANDAIPKITPNGTKSILWLGGHNTFNTSQLKDFDVILTSTPLLRDFLRGENIKAFYLPLFGYPVHEDETATDKKIIALINHPQKVENILQQKHFNYRHYTTERPEEILADMPKFQIAFVNATALAHDTLDLNPIFFTLAENKVPMACFWGWPEVEENINMFNDMINFYITDSEIISILEESVSLSPKIAKRIDDAFAFVSSNHSLNSVTQRLKYILKKQSEPNETIQNNTLNFDLPVSVGHTISGDYGLAKNLEAELDKYGYHTSYSFYNSLYKYPAETNIIIRGTINNNFSQTDKSHILYLAYPQFEGDGERHQLEPNYYDFLPQLLKNFDAIASASESLTEALKARGFKAYYIPQFTDTTRFFHQYDEKLKTDILFVGRFAEYRRAPQIALQHQLPITIYGPHWNGFAQADALDYNELNKYYSSAKIVLNDTRNEMLLHGVISNRIFDATACETLVISDYMPEIEKVYGDTVPMWKTEEELVNLITYYLSPEHETERLDKARRAKEITLHNFTASIAAQTFNQIILDIKKTKGL